MIRRTIGVDLGATNLRAALVDLDAAVLVAEERVKLDDRSPEAVATRLVELVRAVGGEGPVPVSIGVAAMLRGFTGIVENAPNLGWRGVDFATLVAERLGRRVELHNDVGAITFGEAAFGAARGARDVLCVFLGTGIGGGLIVAGRLSSGSSHLAGEIGHTKVIRGGRPCGCGSRGCIEAYAGGRNLAERARGEVAQGLSPATLALAGEARQVHGGHVDEAARRGDPWANALLDEIAPLLGQVLANAVTLVNPARVVVGGTVWQGMPQLRERALVAYRELVNPPSGAATSVVTATLGDNAGLLGNAALAAGMSFD